jgi:indole-3-glycerol phosphate synthase
MSVADVLRRIVEQRRMRLGTVPAPPAPGEPRGLLSRNAFLDAVAAERGRAVIAEIKMGSPSLGRIAERVEPLARARAYAEGGAAALSVVVEPDFFYGSYELLAECREASGLPAVAKDFLVHPSQVHEAASSGADAMLLIAALYESDEILGWADVIRSKGMVPLVETHSRRDAEILAGRSWELVGVNNRDLRTFRVDLDRSIEQVPRLPAEALKVAESGIRHRGDVERLSAAGFDAFLVGETLLLADDPAAAVGELAGKGT